MMSLSPRYSRDEFAQRGQEFIDRQILPNLRPEQVGMFLAVDIESGDFEVDDDDYTATERLLSRNPSAQIWLARVGHRTAYQIGSHGKSP